MSLPEGLNQSAAYVAADLEAMIRERDVRVASHGEHRARLEAMIAKLNAEVQEVTAQEQQAAAELQEAQQVLEDLRTVLARGIGLRQASEPAQTRLVAVSPEHDPTSATATRPAPEPQPATHPVRIAGERTLAVLKILSRDPEREWTPKAVAMELEAGADGSMDRARALLDGLRKREVVTKTIGPDGKQTFYRLTAAWEAA
ncbi:hypothetical protein [Streptomyces sp. WM4235]|uniref:hypothetical protein n=1 Tax=Streptomyces sp. WM4235 TaxID=1415551 RepID=UPI00131D1EC0|nr:hypothetical protein [Streptomyces sp. WM4235]